jgi:hypothetical protein
MLVLRCFLRKKNFILKGLGHEFVCFFFKKNYLDGSGSNECAYRFDFLKYDF